MISSYMYLLYIGTVTFSEDLPIVMELPMYGRSFWIHHWLGVLSPVLEMICSQGHVTLTSADMMHAMLYNL